MVELEPARLGLAVQGGAEILVRNRDSMNLPPRALTSAVF
jgi:hypothetical protein